MEIRVSIRLLSVAHGYYSKVIPTFLWCTFICFLSKEKGFRFKLQYKLSLDKKVIDLSYIFCRSYFDINFGVVVRFNATILHIRGFISGNVQLKSPINPKTLADG